MNARAQTQADTSAVVQGSTAFALDLYSHLRDQPGNLFFSPYSVDTALAMVYAGARGQTATEIGQTLHLPPLAPDQVHAALGELVQRYQADKSDKKYELHVANALWAGTGTNLLPDYLRIVQGNYAARLSVLDFSDSQGSAKTINDWVAGKTNDKIQNLIPASALGAMTRLVLTNAIYFKGTWETPFDAKETAEEPWHGAGTDDASAAKMMQRVTEFGFYQDDALSALQMPYAGGDLAMLVLLPKRNDGIGDLEKSLTFAQLSKIVSQVRLRDVIVSFPKFKVESSFDLNPALAAMGMSTAFSTAADFSGIDGAHDLLISDVVHKAYVDVDEQGTEAAAATGIVMSAMAMPGARPVFNADHPFLFFIRNVRDQTILFAGRIEKP
ncbi:MAG: serpin family protein [Tepidisphaeraceae bacterium]